MRVTVAECIHYDTIIIMFTKNLVGVGHMTAGGDWLPVTKSDVWA